MNNFVSIFVFICLSLIVIFNVIQILAAFLAGAIAFVYLAMSPYDSGVAMLIPILIAAGLAYWLTLPVKLIFYPIMYEYWNKSNIIHKLFDKIIVSKLTMMIALVVTLIIDFLIYLCVPKNVFPIYSHLMGLTICLLLFLLWIKIRKPENNGKRLILFYIVLTILVLLVLFIFNENVIDIVNWMQ